MKLTTEPGALADAVKFAARALTARTAYPILSSLKITADPGGTVEVSAFDYQTSARARVPAEVSEPGTVLALGRLLAEVAARLPRQPATMAEDGAALVLACGSTRYRLHLLLIDTYPALPELAGPAGHADGGEFAAAVRQVVIAASRDDTLPARGAVQVTFTDDTLSLVATDRYPGRAAAAALAASRRPAAAAGADSRPGAGRGG
jgi:DNA polymerase III subunit beta